MIHLMPFYFDNDFYSHFIPENLYKGDDLDIKLYSKYDRKKVNSIVLKYYEKCYKREKKRLDNEFIAFFEEADNKEEFLSLRDHKVIRDYLIKDLKIVGEKS